MRVEQLREAFGLDASEQLCAQFSCAHTRPRWGANLNAGQLYIFSSCLVFHANLLATLFVERIAFSDVAVIRKRSFMRLPNTIAVEASGGACLFTSFLFASRRKAYDAMVGRWRACNPEAAAAYLGAEEGGAHSCSGSGAGSGSGSGAGRRELRLARSLSGSLLSRASLLAGEPPPPFPLPWTELAGHGGELPPPDEGMALAASLELPDTDARTLAEVLLGDNSGFVPAAYLQQGNELVGLTHWQVSGAPHARLPPGSLHRTFRFTFRGEGSWGTVKSSCIQEHVLRVDSSGDRLLLEVRQSMPDLPAGVGRCFTLRMRWSVGPSAAPAEPAAPAAAAPAAAPAAAAAAAAAAAPAAPATAAAAAAAAAAVGAAPPPGAAARPADAHRPAEAVQAAPGPLDASPASPHTPVAGGPQRVAAVLTPSPFGEQHGSMSSVVRELEGQLSEALHGLKAGVKAGAAAAKQASLKLRRGSKTTSASSPLSHGVAAAAAAAAARRQCHSQADLGAALPHAHLVPPAEEAAGEEDEGPQAAGSTRSSSPLPSAGQALAMAGGPEAASRSKDAVAHAASSGGGAGGSSSSSTSSASSSGRQGGAAGAPAPAAVAASASAFAAALPSSSQPGSSAGEPAAGAASGEGPRACSSSDDAGSEARDTAPAAAVPEQPAAGNAAAASSRSKAAAAAGAPAAGAGAASLPDGVGGVSQASSAMQSPPPPSVSQPRLVWQLHVAVEFSRWHVAQAKVERDTLAATSQSLQALGAAGQAWLSDEARRQPLAAVMPQAAAVRHHTGRGHHRLGQHRRSSSGGSVATRWAAGGPGRPQVGQEQPGSLAGDAAGRCWPLLGSLPAVLLAWAAASLAAITPRPLGTQRLLLLAGLLLLALHTALLAQVVQLQARMALLLERQQLALCGQ